jgi:hypothetical protein
MIQWSINNELKLINKLREPKKQERDKDLNKHLIGLNSKK